jgi:hypothetical protein
MPIEICFKPLDGGKEAENRLIEADEDGVLIKNYPGGKEELVGVECSEDGESGLVKIFPAVPALSRASMDTLVKDADMPEPEDQVEVSEDNPYIHFLETQDGAKGLLIVRYASSIAITQSLLIPAGLRFIDQPADIEIIQEEPELEQTPELTGPAEADVLELPALIDQEWCNWFAKKYSGARAGVETDYCYYQSPPTNTGPKQMTEIGTLDPSTDEPILVDGEIVGAKVLSFWNDEDGVFDNIPYVVLTDVKDAEMDMHVYARDPDAELFVPLDRCDDEEIIVYTED